MDCLLKRLFIALVILLPAYSNAQVLYPGHVEFTKPEYRAFDFWIGEWSVDLKIRNEKNEWPVRKHAITQVFPVLQGKAIMELWNERTEDLTGIRGLSLRYYNAETDQWDLILNWPRPNWGRTAVFHGTEIHGRFDFYNRFPINDSTYQTIRYSFSDIKPNSLRWDDSYSQDNGKTWTNNWIMEFNRVKPLPEALKQNEAHTYLNGECCNQDQYQPIKNMANIESFSWTGADYQASTYKILDGCAIIIFGVDSKNSGSEKLLFFSYNTPESKYEMIELNTDKKPMNWYKGFLEDNTFSFGERESEKHFQLKLTQNNQFVFE